jgi:hypothetical protein
MSTITLQTYAVAVHSLNGTPLVVVKCHNRATAEVVKARAERNYLATYGVPTLAYTIAAPGEQVIAAGGDF